MLRGRHLAQERTLFEFFEKRKLSGEFPNATDSSLLAKYIATFVQGMSVQARDGADTEQLGRIVDILMHAWPQLRSVPMPDAGTH